MKQRILSRRKEHRKSLIINLTKSLITYGQIITTIAKAKTLRPYIEPLITKAKVNTLQTRRYLLSKLQNDERVVNKLFEIGLNQINRPGGYTQIIRESERNGITRAIITILSNE